MAAWLLRVWHWWGSWLYWLMWGGGSTARTSGLPVTIRTEQGQNLSVHIQLTWDMRQVQSAVLAQLGLPAATPIRLILAGRRLAPEVRVGDCDLGAGTTLHAIRVLTHCPEQADDGTQHRPLNQSLVDLEISGGARTQPASSPEAQARRLAHFYVYCDAPCHALQPGKLRVRCASCQDGGIVLAGEPTGWSDVLVPDRIQGTCNLAACPTRGTLSWARFYFKCASHPASEDTPPLYLIRSNLYDVPCLACLDVGQPVVVFECPEKHVSCVECFQNYCRTRLNERQFQLHPDHGYTLPCPVGCADSLVRETRHFKLIGDHDYERYQRFGTEEFVLQSGGVLCPRPDCGMGIIMDEPCRRVVCENGCGFAFCRDCLQGYHIGECEAQTETESDAAQSLMAVGENAVRARWVNADPSSLAIQLTTKPCPKCRTPTERSGGCMHMVCTKAACGFHWCWICQTEWTRDCMASHWFG
ncbi:E3 ubiquitin-protein ligase parkin-like [Tigriopus californicus]|uniref:E3 ubiquitin-protein ligase parkin-like n=1 Tax=Tigriopus californicus TaxID=6832 RepID=UPI0027D9F25B|nr:E3 ubiquitin-protein ligase parkin-like [Tigriopus californicus]